MTTVTETPYKNFLEFDDLEESTEESHLIETLENSFPIDNVEQEGKPTSLDSTFEEQQKSRNQWRQKKEQKEKREMQKIYSTREVFERRNRGKNFETVEKKRQEKKNNSSKEFKPRGNQKRRALKEETTIDRKREESIEEERNHLRNVPTEEKRNKSELMFSLWQKERQNDGQFQNGRNSVPQWNPSLSDLHSAVFLPSNSFNPGEVILVPRTRGGFSYGKISKQTSRSHCYFDPQFSHKSFAWRVVYYGSGKPLFKDLPSAYIGKLKHGPTKQMVEQGVVSESLEQRVVGTKGSRRDLQSVVFSPQCHFSVGEIVLVPRSGGGFTYGRISKETKQNCITAPTKQSHLLNAWRIIVSEDDPGNVTRKDLAAALIGKIHLLGTGDPQKPIQFAEEVIPPEKEELVVHKEEKECKSLSIEDEEDESEYSLKDSMDNTGESNKNDDDTGKTCNEVSEENFKEIDISTLEANKGPTLKVKDAEVPVNQIGGLLHVNKRKLLKNLMTKNLTKEEKKHLIVIDGPNVAKKHGKETEFSANGIKIALDYFIERGHDAVAFLPEHHVKRKPGQSVTLQEFYPKANNVPLLLELIDEGKVVLTPPQDYDDSYCIEYAMRHDGVIVTNDRYWDYVDKQKEEKGEKARQQARRWIRDHTMSFTFVRDEFLPNPNFNFPPFKSEKS